MVFTDIEKYRDARFFSIEGKYYSNYDLYMGTSPDSCQESRLGDIKPFTKYYWYVVAHEPNKYDNTAQSEIRTFYYVTTPKITKVYNPEGDWATILKWEHNDYMKEATVTLTPDKDCQYDKTPIVVDAAQDSCYISAGGEFNTDSQKYAVYHQWWDDSKAQYYEPVVYSFNVKFRGEIDGHSYSVTSDTVKYIFLDRAKYAADMQFNVYRMGQIGSRTWLLEDLRGNVKDDHGKDDFLESVLLTSPLGFKARAYYANVLEVEYKYSSVIPEGFHLASDDDWQDLEYTYGLEKNDNRDYKTWIYNESDRSSEFVYLRRYIDFSEEYNLKKDSISFVGQRNHLFYKMISDKEWIMPDSNDSSFEGLGALNIRPYGVVASHGAPKDTIAIGSAAAYLTSTFNYDDSYPKHIIRFFWGGNTGVARVWIYETYYNMYLFRCVKDE